VDRTGQFAQPYLAPSNLEDPEDVQQVWGPREIAAQKERVKVEEPNKFKAAYYFNATDHSPVSLQEADRHGYDTLNDLQLEKLGIYRREIDRPRNISGISGILGGLMPGEPLKVQPELGRLIK